MFNKEINGQIYASYRARDAVKYKAGLFPEGPSGIRPIDLIFRLTKITERVNGKFYFSPAVQNGNDPTPVSLNKIMRKVGGQKEFFKDGSRILDVGSGAGVATSQLFETFPKAQFVGIDQDYILGIKPAYKDKGNFVGADWNNLPFQNNSFTRLMSVESFPKHADWIWDYSETFKEMTRICKSGAIWRGTHFGADYGLKVFQGDRVKEMINQLNANGWDVYVANRIFIAKLVNKIA